MANMLLATKQFVEDGTLTAEGTLSSSLPIANLATDQPGEVARWTSLTGMAIVLDLGEAKAISLLALVAHNGTSAAEWRIRAAPDETSLTDGSEDLDTGSVSMWPATGRPDGYDDDKLSSIHYIAAGQSSRWWRIDITDAANPDTFFEAGALIVDAAFQPSINMAFGQGIGFDDPSEHVRTAGGQRWATPTGKARVVTFRLAGQSEADLMGTAFEIDRKRGNQKPVLWIFDPEETTHLHRGTVYGLMEGRNPFVRPNFNVFEKTYRIAEMIA